MSSIYRIRRLALRRGAAALLALLLLMSLAACSKTPAPADTGGAGSSTVPISPAPAQTKTETDSAPQTETPAPETEAPAPDESWKLLLVNADHPLPEGFEVELKALRNGHHVDIRVYPELQQMFDDARAEGIYPYINESFRTAQRQQEILDSYISRYEAQGMSRAAAEEKALQVVALPGTPLCLPAVESFLDGEAVLQTPLPKLHAVNCAWKTQAWPAHESLLMIPERNHQ